MIKINRLCAKCVFEKDNGAGKLPTCGNKEIGIPDNKPYQWYCEVAVESIMLCNGKLFKQKEGI